MFGKSYNICPAVVNRVIRVHPGLVRHSLDIGKGPDQKYYATPDGLAYGTKMTSVTEAGFDYADVIFVVVTRSPIRISAKLFCHAATRSRAVSRGAYSSRLAASPK